MPEEESDFEEDSYDHDYSRHMMMGGRKVEPNWEALRV